MTEYQASQPAARPAAAFASPDTPIVTCPGMTERMSRIRSRAWPGTSGTPGILIEAMPGSSAMRPYSSVPNVKCVVPGLSQTITGSDEFAVTVRKSSNTSSSVSGW